MPKCRCGLEMQWDGGGYSCPEQTWDPEDHERVCEEYYLAELSSEAREAAMAHREEATDAT